jgi:hypothetical protein
MKARVKATGEIVEVVSNGLYYESIKDERIFDKPELEIMSKTKDPDYWTRLEHQYAGMAMQGILSNSESELDYNGDETFPQALAGCAAKLAHALVQKMKEVK